MFIRVACLAHLLSAVGLVDSMFLAQFAEYQFTYVGAHSNKICCSGNGVYYLTALLFVCCN